MKLLKNEKNENIDISMGNSPEMVKNEVFLKRTMGKQ